MGCEWFELMKMQNIQSKFRDFSDTDPKDAIGPTIFYIDTYCEQRKEKRR